MCNYLGYFSSKEASRNGWVNEIGWIMVKYKETSPTTPEEGLEAGITIDEFNISI